MSVVAAIYDGASFALSTIRPMNPYQDVLVRPLSLLRSSRYISVLIFTSFEVASRKTLIFELLALSEDPVVAASPGTATCTRVPGHHPQPLRARSGSVGVLRKVQVLARTAPGAGALVRTQQRAQALRE